MKATLTTRAVLPWSRDLAWVKKELTLVSKPLSPLGTPARLDMYQIIGNDIHIPKAWALDNGSKLGIATWEDKQHAPEAIDRADMEVELPQGLRPHQTQAVDAIMKAFRSDTRGGGCLLCLSCGMGKSITALVVAHRMGLKTLIIVNTAILATQWRNVIAQYIPRARVGMIQQAKFEVEGRTHVVAVAHTVAGGRHDFSGAGFGLMIIDETHRVCCPTLSRCIAVAGCRYRLGLTATPVRPDGFNAFLLAAIGPIAFQVTREKSEDLRVYSIHLDSGPSKLHTVFAKGKHTPCISKMVNDMQPDAGNRAAERQDLAAGWIALCLSKRRQILVVADRIGMLEDLSERVLRATADVTTAFLIGKTKAKDRDSARDANVILASFACAAEGLDVPTIDTLLLLTPRSGKNCIVQVVGRLMRDGGRSPLVIDIVDDLQVFQNMYRKRCTEYRRLGAVITAYDERRVKLPNGQSRIVQEESDADDAVCDFVEDEE